MRVRITTLLTILTLTATLSCYGQSYEPMDLAKRIFGKEKKKKKKEHITGEYKTLKGKPNGQHLLKGTTTQFTLLEQTEKTAVVAMTVLNSYGKGFDSYLHFEKDIVWKMSAFRALAQTGIIQLVLIELEKMTPQEIDEIIADTTRRMFTSREEYDFELGNCKLTLELDDNIITHFVANQDEFERLKNLALSQLEREEIEEERSFKLIESEKNDYQKLFISSVSKGGYELYCNCIDFLIGGILDNTVGYFYIKDKKDLPKMNPNRIIMIREIGNGWYLYKTT
jgi:hypothetical protein